ncbi:MAG: acyl-phosphate glycerol 3-phosphate acyltransferase [Rhodospirillaceae bacterium]|nr:acyl-phosphate glycerol 3-phosphate acyltransferase [Rhodospirillaceae bacterium]|tara:strand:+ start:4797 stop:5399 length:603 start_codon:yes stop_codon:yes gene_type:complete
MISPISWEFSYPYILTALGCGYLLGSIPFGYLITRYAGLGDIRSVGSGNIGATNVLRTGKKHLAAATLIMDTGKGVLTVLIGSQFGPDIQIIAAFGALCGHFFPIWLRFKGGKGVATSLGLMLALTWPIALCSLATWVAVIFLTRYSSLAALIASALAPILAWYFSTAQIAEFYTIMVCLIWVRHFSNIKRLLSGTETKI